MFALFVLASLPAGYVLFGNFLLLARGDGFPLHDGMALWLAGHLAVTGQGSRLYQPLASAAALLAHDHAAGLIWFYPPTSLLFAAPFGWLPPAAGVLLFDAASLAVLLAALRAAGCGWALTGAVLACPAALQSLGGNQNGAMFAGLLIAGLFLAPARPWAAGFLLGVATVKPQLGLLVPFYLLGRRDWRTIAAAGATAILLALFSLSQVPPAGWNTFLTQMIPQTQSFLVALTGPGRHGAPALMSVFAALREAGASPALAAAGQLAATAGAILAAYRVGRAATLPAETRIVLLLLLGVLATPYLWYYDMIPGSLAAALLIRSGLATGFTPGAFLALCLFWATPGIALFAALAHWPTFAAPLAMIIVIDTWRRHAATPPPADL
jgi:hypothetical protein